MEQIDEVMARLRLLLAQVAQRREQTQGLQRQFERQMERVTGYGSYGEIDLEQLLALMADLEDKLQEVGKTLSHLSRIESRAKAELESLELTKMIEQAKVEVSSLESQPSLDPEQRARVKSLRRLISEASEAAGRRIAGRRTQ